MTQRGSGGSSIIAMGGTIDKEYVVGNASLEVCQPFAEWLQPKLRLQRPFDVHVLARKDSLDLTAEDRRGLITLLKRLGKRRVVVTHGTSTLLKTAEVLTEAVAHGELDPGATVVLTGSFVPGRFPGSDAEFNVGFAVGVAQAAVPGIYVAAGAVFAPASEVKHTPERFTFDGQSA